MCRLRKIRLQNVSFQGNCVLVSSLIFMCMAPVMSLTTLVSFCQRRPLSQSELHSWCLAVECSTRSTEGVAQSAEHPGSGGESENALKWWSALCVCVGRKGREIEEMEMGREEWDLERERDREGQRHCARLPLWVRWSQFVWACTHLLLHAYLVCWPWQIAWVVRRLLQNLINCQTMLKVA